MDPLVVTANWKQWECGADTWDWWQLWRRNPRWKGLGRVVVWRCFVSSGKTNKTTPKHLRGFCAAGTVARVDASNTLEKGLVRGVRPETLTGCKETETQRTNYTILQNTKKDRLYTGLLSCGYSPPPPSFTERQTNDTAGTRSTAAILSASQCLVQ
ncbi:MAG: uncharacterized protein A8A55_2266 [Amphiamblys sp. WSBS2006]|nr:MAG: uncharacterized protein A8A55_2266 [Amphiamblys sp. WSBS2006]